MARTPLLFLVLGLLPLVVVGTRGALAEDSQTGPCQWGRYELLTKEQVLECLRTVPWNPELAEDIHRNLEKYVDMNAFRQDLLEPPAEFEWLKHDQLKDLKVLEARARKTYGVDEGAYEYEYQAYEDLIKLFNKSYDPNTYLELPECYEDIAYVHIVKPVFKLVNGITVPTFAFINENAIHPYEIMVKRYPEGHYYNAEFLIKLQGDEIKKINGMNPLEYYEKFSLSLNASRDKGSLMNAAIDGKGREGTLGDGFPMDNVVTYTVMHEEEEYDVVVPYYYISLHKISSADMFQGMCHGTVEVNAVERSIPEYLTYNTYYNFATPRYEKAAIRSRGILEYMAAEIAIDDNVTMLNIRAQIRDKHVKNIDAWVPTSNFKSETFTGWGRHFWIQHYLSLDKTESAVVIKAPEPITKKWIYADMLEEIQNAVKEGDRIVIDIRNNVGKTPSMNYEYDIENSKTLFHPNTKHWKMAKTETTRALLDSNVLKSSKMGTYITESFDDLFTAATRIDNNPDNDNYTKSFIVGKSKQDSDKEELYFFADLLSKMDLDETQAIVITNGLCSGTCASFIEAIKEFTKVPVVTTGGYSAASRSVKNTSDTTCSGEFIATSDAIFNAIIASGVDYENNEKLPGKLPYHLRLSIPIAKEYSQNGKTLAFNNIMPDYHLFWYENGNPEKSADKDYPELLDQVWSIMEKHPYSHPKRILPVPEEHIKHNINLEEQEEEQKEEQKIQETQETQETQKPKTNQTNTDMALMFKHVQMCFLVLSIIFLFTKPIDRNRK